MTVRAKFKLTEQANKDHGQDGILSDYKFTAVTEGSPENKDFWKWTPAGQITLNCVNPQVLEEFTVGQEYYVDFTPAEK